MQGKCKILENKNVAHNFFKMRIAAPQIAKVALPGQFLNIRLSNSYQPLLRKPLGIHRVNKRASRDSIEILYKVVGQGTKLLSRKSKGQTLDILGPLGNDFLQASGYPRDRSGNIFVLGGGIGIAPLLFLVEYLLNTTKIDACNISVFIGASSRNHVLAVGDFKRLGPKVAIATEDGSSGFKGRVTDLFSKTVVSMNSGLSTIYACGPRPMLKAIAQIGKEFNANCFGLLEEYMACGTGACFGCVVLTKSGFKRVCKEGPVFDLRVIKW